MNVETFKSRKNEMDYSAILSTDGVYRYELRRMWGRGRILCYIMLNPSTADGLKDDPTITRCMVRAQMLGYGGMVVVNLFAYRSTDKTVLRDVVANRGDAVGPLNDHYLVSAAKEADLVICGWSDYGRLSDRADHVIEKLKGQEVELYALELNKYGRPKHPLYLKYEIEPVFYI